MPRRYNRGGRPLRPTTWVQGEAGEWRDRFTVAYNESNTTTRILCDWDDIRLETGANPTLIRTRGSVACSFGTSAVAASIWSGALGLAIMNNRYVSNAGGPDPTATTDFDWLYWRRIYLTSATSGQIYWDGDSAEVASVAVPGPGEAAFMQLDIDTKAMRKLEPGDQVVLCVKAIQAECANDPTGVFAPGFRCLIKQ